MTTKSQSSSPLPNDAQGNPPNRQPPKVSGAPARRPASSNNSPAPETDAPSVTDRPVEASLPTQYTEQYGSPRFRVGDPNQPSYQVITLAVVVILGLGLILQNAWIGLPAAGVALFLSLRVLWFPLQAALQTWLGFRYQQWILAGITTVLALVTIAQFTGVTHMLGQWEQQMNWEAFGALSEGFGALGQISVAFLALYVAWRQYIITKLLTQQQNRITQQQTIDAYFQGISELVLDEEGLLEDWPPERAIAEGRTAAILSGLDPQGKAKVIRFLSSAKLLTPLRRDRRLGRPIFDGLGGYEEDIEYGGCGSLTWAICWYRLTLWIQTCAGLS